MVKLFEVASQIATPLGLAGVVVIALFLIYRLLIQGPLAAQLSRSHSFHVINRIVTFVFVLGLVAIILSIVAFVVWKVLPEPHRGTLNIDIRPTDGYSDIAPGKQFKVNLHLLNPGPERLRRVASLGRLAVEDVDAQTDHRIRKRLEMEIIPLHEQYNAGKLKVTDQVSVGVGGLATVKTIPTPTTLTQNEVDGIRNGIKRIYLVLWYTWTDSQGRIDFQTWCGWLQIHTLPTLMWQLCQ